MVKIGALGFPKISTADLEDDAVTLAKTALKGRVKIHSSLFSTTSASVEELATKTVSADDFAVGDRIIVEIDTKPPTALNDLILRVVEGATSDTIIFADVASTSYIINAEIMQRPDANTELNSAGQHTDVAGTEANFGQATGSMTEDWIKQAFAISLRGATSASTFAGNWSIYKMVRS